MKKEKLVISLGGSLIIPNKVDFNFLKKFRSLLENNSEKYQFIIVCGGGAIARKRIAELREEGKSEKEQSLAGIEATRQNATILIKLYDKNKKVNKTIPLSISSLKNQIKKYEIIFLGALEYQPKETSDSSAAKIANFLKCEFVNLTNVNGLYTSNPKIKKSAKFIPEISWENFEKRASRIKYKPGLHFVLDPQAAKIIKKNKTPTYIIGRNIKNFNKFLNKEKFTGTLIYG